VPDAAGQGWLTAGGVGPGHQGAADAAHRGARPPARTPAQRATSQGSMIDPLGRGPIMTQGPSPRGQAGARTGQRRNPSLTKGGGPSRLPSWKGGAGRVSLWTSER
jgi:hypothetical protein